MAITDIDIHRTAWVLIRQHGEGVVFHAAMQADAYLERGNIDGQLLWTRIMRAVEEL